MSRLSYTYSLQDKSRLLAALAPNLIVDYSGVVAAWGRKEYNARVFADEWLSEKHLGLKPLATQHLLGLHYFKSVSEKEIVVEWQQIASHGRQEKGENSQNPLRKIEEQSNHRTYVEHTFVKTEKGWKIAVIKPSVLFSPGDFMKVRRAED
jgi:scytalone dehydratase